MRRIFWALIVALILFSAGFLLAWMYLHRDTQTPVEESTILLEKIDKVCKLVTVEGHFVEYYEYGDPPAGPWFIGPFFNWQTLLPRKSARLRVRAKVMVGYDLEQIEVNAYQAEKRITVGNLPEPTILSVDHEIDYFDRDESIFRPLTEKDYLDMYAGAEEKIREAAKKSELLEAARQQGNELFDLIDFMVTNAGWNFEVLESDRPNTQPPPGMWDHLD
jgi:hypothetical protein